MFVCVCLRMIMWAHMRAREELGSGLSSVCVYVFMNMPPPQLSPSLLVYPAAVWGKRSTSQHPDVCLPIWFRLPPPLPQRLCYALQLIH